MMRITEGLSWVGICTDKFDETIAFFKKLTDGKVIQEGLPKTDFQFEMKDVAEFLTPILEEKPWRWTYFRAPDGNIYQLQQRC